MTGRPTIALLIPAYNAAAFLPRLLKSAANQTEAFSEVLVYDDCSTDDTAKIAEVCGAKVIRGSVNRGCSAGKNVLARAVKADYIHFHDADDELLPNFVSLARSWIDKGAPDVVLFAYEYRQDGSNELLSVRVFDHLQLTIDPRSYAIREQINPFCGMYRRSAMLAAGGYDEDPSVLYNEDVAFHIQLAFSGLTFGAEPEISIINYRRGGSMSGANQLKCFRAHLSVLKKTLKRPDAASYRSELAEKFWNIAGLLGAYSAWQDADEAARIAATLAPPTKNAGGSWYRLIARLNPRLALRIREAAIRVIRPHLRQGYG
jgi:glycosyltransferase involved in cell wall biosynthesis